MKSIIFVVLVALVGCANQETLMRNSSGDVRYCYLVHDSTLAKIGAVQEYNKCLNQAAAKGYRRVE